MVEEVSVVLDRRGTFISLPQGSRLDAAKRDLPDSTMISESSELYPHHETLVFDPYLAFSVTLC